LQNFAELSLQKGNNAVDFGLRIKSQQAWRFDHGVDSARL
jgi:hypothetical protein